MAMTFKNIDQDTIIKKCIEFVKLQASRFPNKYKETDVEKFSEAIKKGQCSGLAALWLYRKMDGKEDKLFFSILQRISDWNPKKDPEAELSADFEQFINDMRWAFQMDHEMSKYEQREKDKTLEVVKPEKGFSLVEEFNMAFIFKKNELIETIDKIIREDRMVYVQSHNHAIGIVKKERVFHVYDPNSTDGEVRVNFASEVAEHLENCFLKSNNNPTIPITFDIFRTENQKPIEYPSFKQIIEGFRNNENLKERSFMDEKGEIETLLSFSLRNSNFNNIDFLISKGCNVRSVVLDGHTPLSLAVMHGPTETVQSIVDALVAEDTEKKPGLDRIFTKENNTPLMYAASFGYIEKLKILINAGADVNAKNRNNQTPLMNAAEQAVKAFLSAKAAVNEIKKLLKEDADIKIVEALLKDETNDLKSAQALLKEKVSAFAVQNLLKEKDRLEAIAKDYLETVKSLVEAKANLNVADKDGWTPLMHAASAGHSEVVKILLEAKANVDSVNNKGATPLMLAAQNGHTEVVKELLKANVNVNALNNQGATPLMLAAQKGYLETVKSLVEAKANLNVADKDGWTPLMYAASAGHSEVVKILLEAKANVDSANNQGSTPLMLAAQNGHKEVVKELLKADVKVNALSSQGATPLMLAAQNGHTEIVKELLKAGAQMDNINTHMDNINTQDWTPLMLAAQNGHTEIVKELLKTGAKMDGKNSQGLTPLILAAQNDHTEIVKELLKAGANVNAVNSAGHGAINFAVAKRNQAMIFILLTAAFFSAIKQENIANVKKYASVDQLLNIKDDALQTPLIAAIEQGNLEIVKILLDAKADVNIINKDGLTPLLLAKQKGHLQMIDILKSAGAKDPETEVNALKSNSAILHSYGAKQSKSSVPDSAPEDSRNQPGIKHR